MQTVETNDVKLMLDNRQDIELINVLPQEMFEKEHIPGSKNIPIGEENFEEQVENEAGGKDRRIVLYCASEQCDASPKAAKRLEEAGFENVYDYHGGVKAWKDAGLALESSA